ncbi:MAG: FAD-binding oxidoreductase [Ahniella sp.]|nr:FAD-binding oxidoreductase [Ahniella sp.]
MNRREWLAFLALLPLMGSARALAPKVEAARGVRFVALGDAEYAGTRGGFAKRVMRQPALLALCSEVDGVRRALEVAAESGLKVGIRSGGHCFEGHGLIDGGMLIDLSAMNAVSVANERAVIGPGAKLGGVYQQLGAAGRLLPAGSCAGVGVAGLALGGGYGFFARQYGLTSDHLVGLDLITSDGRHLRAEGDDELLVACRGGGNGHFGVVTKFEFQTQRLPSRFASFRWRFRQLDVPRARALAERFCGLAADLPRTCYGSFVLNGRTLTVLVTDFADQMSPALAKRLAEFGRDATETPAPREDGLLPGIQRFSGGTTPMYFKNFSAGYYADWADLARGFDPLAAIVLERKPTSILQINTLGSAIADRSVKSVYAHRKALFLGEFQVYWNTPAQAAAALALAASARTEIERHWTAHYANYPNDEFRGAAEAYYGNQLGRLQALKKKLDPDRRFQEASAI